MIFLTLSKVVASVDIALPKRSCALSHQDTTIDHDGLTGHVPGGVGAQERYHSTDIFDGSHSAERDARKVRVAGLVWHGGGHRRFD